MRRVLYAAGYFLPWVIAGYAVQLLMEAAFSDAKIALERWGDALDVDLRMEDELDLGERLTWGSYANRQADIAAGRAS